MAIPLFKACSTALAKGLTNQLHCWLEPLQSVLRKQRLRAFDIAPGAVLPVAVLQPGPSAACTDPLCPHYAADARRFHRRNAPRHGLARWRVPSAMLLDLARFDSGESYARAVSKRSRGNIARAVKRAERSGMTCVPIQMESYRKSISDIRSSKRVRSGGPVLAAWFANAAAGEIDTMEPPATASCPEHWTLCWGAFVETELGPRLVAYLSLRRVGDMCRTHDLMAHGDFLDTGAMKLLFLHVARWLLDRQAAETRGLRWFMYGAVEHGGAGLHMWKRLMCFEPGNLSFMPAEQAADGKRQADAGHPSPL